MELLLSAQIKHNGAEIISRSGFFYHIKIYKIEMNNINRGKKLYNKINIIIF